MSCKGEKGGKKGKGGRKGKQKGVIPLAVYHKHPVYDTDNHLVINPETRTIKNDSGKTVLMQNDHNSERFTFEIQRYIDGHDMTLCNIVEVHYINIDSSNKANVSADVYPVTDTQISPDSDEVVIGSWLISSNATVYAGSLNFIFRFACTDPDTSEITYQWFTDIYTGLKVSKGLYNTNVVTEDDNSDVLAAWKKEIVDEASAKVSAISDAAMETLKEVKDSMADLEKRIENTEFSVNFETGNLEYVSQNYRFNVNTETGNLEWSVA